MDLLEELEELSSRTPGRGLQMHQKLSSPSRKKALSETIRLHQERQQKASRTRRTLMDQKTQKLSEISIKVSQISTAAGGAERGVSMWWPVVHERALGV